MPETDWFVVYAKGHHGYPQPEESWQAQVYASHCPSCGVHGPQSSVFRFGRSNRAPHSHFRQLNWVFDAWFVQPTVETALRAAGVSGINFQPALDHKSGNPLEHMRQLLVATVVQGADTSRLPTVTCRPGNEEAHLFPLYPATGPFCGAVKHHPPTSLVIPSHALEGTADLVHTAAWFGSGGQAFRLTVASRRFIDVVRQHGWRGLESVAVSHCGHSERAA